MNIQEPATTQTILIVEDDPTNGEVLSLIIANELGYLPLLAPNGEEALRAIQNIKPILFVIDYFLPGINGLQLYNQLHIMSGLQAVPAIFLSASSIEKDDAEPNIVFLAKPFELEELIRTIEKLLSSSIIPLAEGMKSSQSELA